MEKRRKTATINIRMEPELKQLVEKAAADDRRSITTLLEKLLVDYLRERGYLSQDKSKRD